MILYLAIAKSGMWHLLERESPLTQKEINERRYVPYAYKNSEWDLFDLVNITDPANPISEFGKT